MKNPIIIMLFGLATMFTSNLESQVLEISPEVYGELTKSEKKQWKKAAREYKRNPKKLKVLTKEHEFYRQQATNLQTQLDEKNLQLSQLQAQVSSLETELKGIADLQATTLDLSGSPEKGIVFKLQIGAFEKVKLPKDLEDAKKVDTEESVDVQKILLGSFRDYGQAKKFQGYLKEMGVKDAWIVSYLDGTRVPIEEALRIKP